MNRILLKILFLVLLISHFNVVAQNKTVSQPVSNIIALLEARYNVSFSYLDSILEAQSTLLPPENASLEEAISFLNKNSDLNFAILSNKTIIIQTKNKENEQKIEALEEVLITSYLTKGIILKNDASISIQPSEFEILPGLSEPDVLQTIKSLPGITSIDETVSNLSIRGGTHDQNLILWDGIKMYQSGHFFGLISAYNPYILNTIEVIKNGTSAKHGDGISGTINMQSDHDLNSELSGGLGFNLIHSNAFVKLPIVKNLEIQVSARRSITDIVETVTYDQYFQRVFQDTDVTNNANRVVTTNEAFRFYDFSGKVLYDISANDKLQISVLNIDNNLKYLEEENASSTINDAFENGISQNNLASSFSYTREWNSKFSSELKGYYSRYSLNATDFDIVNNFSLNQANEVLDTGIKLETNYRLNSNINLANGYQFYEVGISNLAEVNDPRFKRYIKEVLRSHAAYSEASYKSTDKNTFIRLGVRANYHTRFDELIIEPRLSFNQKVFGYFRIEALGEFKNQPMSQVIDLQNDFLGIEKRRWVLANNNTIPIVNSKQGSLGIHYSRNKLLISLEAYLKEVNGITSRSQGFQNQYQFAQTTGKYDTKGIDLLINKQSKNYSAWLSYSLSKNNYSFKDLNDSRDFPNNSDIRHDITIAGAYSLHKFKFSLGVNWRAGKPTTKALEISDTSFREIVYDSPNALNLNSYLKTDVSSTYEFNFSKTTIGKVGLSVWNLLNRKNTLNRYYIIENNEIQRKENESLGLTPNISFRVEF